MNFLELKVPPPIVALCLAALMWFAASLTQPLEAPFGVRAGIAVVLVLVGQGIAIAGMVSFRRAKTTINPLKPGAASSLVSNGVYRYTRNPMYLGMLITLLAWAAYLCSLPALLLVPLFVLYINRFQIAPEERVLSSLFAAEYATYRSEVRRWI